MTHLVIVEGVSDRVVLENIARVLGVSIDVRVLRGDKPEKAVRLANSLVSVLGYEKVIILKNLHKLPETKVSKIISEILKGIKHQRRYAVIVRRSIESWILAGIGIRNPEKLNDPEAQLDILLRRSKDIPYIKTPKTLNDLTKDLDINKAIENSETLRRFISIVKDP